MRSGVAFVLRSVGMVLLATAPAHAVPFTLEIYADGTLLSIVDNSDLGCTDTGPHTTSCSAGRSYSNQSYTALRIDSIQLDLDSDPLLDGNLSVTNEQNFDQRFTFVFNLPITSIPAPTYRSGSISGSVADNNGNGATISSPAGEPIYQARVDGVNTNALHADPVSFSAPPSDDGSIPAVSFGPVLGGPASNSIEIEIDFFLTALDSVQITSEFKVVPEPASAALVALGLALLAARSRSGT